MIKVRQVKIDVLKDNENERYKLLLKKLRVSEEKLISYEISKQSIDARNKDEIFYVYEFNVSLKDEENYLNHNKSNDIVYFEKEEFKLPCTGDKKIKNNIVIVGSGPAGLFASYILSENGYNPVVIERGKPVEERTKDVEEFWKTGKLNINSNVQFGEGGAGTFSDGKLNTLVKDKLHLGTKVFETFVKHGASKEILYSFKPHIGTDVLSKVVVSMREEIIKNGGKFLYETMLTNIICENNEIKKIEVNNKDIIDVDALVVATGHSARETFMMLHENGMQMENKPFAVGIRCEHDQKMIDISQYGKKYADVLSKAPYKLTYQASNKKGVYSFCMCPGGYVVNASSKEGYLAINGMSYSKRDSKNANSAIVVTVDENDYGKNLFDGIKFQEKLEKKAFEMGNGAIPSQSLRDYYDNTLKNTNLRPIIKGNISLCNINDILPNSVNMALKEAFRDFGKKIKGFDRDDTILHAVESRTSSPIKMVRDETLQSNIKGIFPCGEGAGYAGGITTSAIDGIRVAIEISKIYTNKKF